MILLPTDVRAIGGIRLCHMIRALNVYEDRRAYTTKLKALLENRFKKER
jgi:hypothetical protein